MAENGRFVGPRGPNYNPILNFLLITSKYTKKHHIKKSDEFIHCNIIKVQKTAKIAKNGYFLALKDQIVTLFYDFLQMTSKQAQKHHIKKSEN